MENKSDAVLADPPPLNAGRRAVHETARLCLGYLVLVGVSLTVSLLAILMRPLLPRVLSRRWGRVLVAASFRSYLRLLVFMGACRFDLTALDALQAGPAVIIAPNHPSLLDAIMILSRLPNATCIMKADIVNNVFFGAGARLVGYIRNTPLRTMVQLAVADLSQGNSLLLFPEGTRTRRLPVERMQGTTSLISKFAGVPVQTIFIETDSKFLGKGWSLLWTPKMPVTYRVRLGKCFEPASDTAHFTAELEHYFHAELKRTPSSSAAVSSPLA
ncbi:MAG: lysophospholipid acyltransferase family protein [Polaromonas sp.]|uniref:lysophospholipid acyltransferase family protein n=1 Tax=Polaromonas sp. TaxID=1869339 RepID=UPI0032648FCE